MPDRPLLFDIYRLNIVDEGLLPFMGAAIQADSEILRVLSASTDNRFDLVVDSARATYKWSLREFTTYDTTEGGEPTDIVGVTLAIRTCSQRGCNLICFPIFPDVDASTC
jgi:hypothetical protein